MVSQKIAEYLDFKGIPAYKFEDTLGTGRGTISKAIKENRNLGSDILEKSLKEFPDINPDWLLTGRGAMLRSDEPAHKATPSPQGLPIIPLEAIGGVGTDHGQQISLHTIEERYVVPDFDQAKADYLIRIRGSSMSPKYHSGDIVACRIVHTRLLVQWNKPYILDLEEYGALCKRIKPSEKPDHWLLVSDNEKYPPFDVPLSFIRHLSIVVGVIRLE